MTLVWREILFRSHRCAAETDNDEKMKSSLLSGMGAPDRSNDDAGPRFSGGSLIALGISNTIGAGIFVLTGIVAAHNAGPAVVLAYALAGVACLCTGLCYAELAAMCSAAGSAYTYALVAVGELAAWVIGWDLILEFLVSGATVAVGWSGYLLGLLGSVGITVPRALTEGPLKLGAHHQLVLHPSWGNVPAMVLIGIQAVLLLLGVRQTRTFINIAVSVLIGIIVLTIIAAGSLANASNLKPFIPDNLGEFGRFGFSGVFTGAAIVFFSYTGFEAVSTATREVRNPARDLPIGLLGSLGVCASLYILASLAMVGITRYQTLDTAEPVVTALQAGGSTLSWLIPIVRAGIVVGLSAASMGSMYAQTRILHAMAADGLLPESLSGLHPTRHTPTLATIAVGLSAIFIAGVFPLEVLGELVSIGTLFAFTSVCVSVLILRYRDNTRPRPFRAPGLIVAAPAGIGINVALMLSLPRVTWLRFLIWMTVGIVFYIVYRRRRLVAASRTEVSPRA